MGRAVGSLLSLVLAACLSSPDRIEAQRDGGGGLDGGGSPDASAGQPREVFRSIGSGSGTIVDAYVTLTQDPTVIAMDELTLSIGPGDVVEVGGSTYFVRSVDGVKVELESPYLDRAGLVTFRRAYESLDQWRVLRPYDLVAADVREVAVLQASQLLAGPIVVTGFVTDADHTLTLRAGVPHGGLEGAGIVIESVGGASSCLEVQGGFVRIEGLGFRGCGDENGEAAVRLEDGSSAVLDRLLVSDFASTESTIAVAVRASSAILRNSVVVDGVTGISVDDASDARVENCTFFRLSDDGVDLADLELAPVEVYNSIFVAATYDGAVDVLTACVSDDLTDDATIHATAAELFTSLDPSAPDLHLAATAIMALTVAQPLLGGFGHDIDGESRGATWDIGADERSPDR